MRKTLFLEFKTTESCDTEPLLAMGVTHVMVPVHKLTRVQLRQFQDCGIKVEPVVTLRRDVCPLHPLAWDALRRHIVHAMTPATDARHVIWFDHLRFDGNWEASLVSPPGLHADCKWCKGKNRLTSMARLANKIKAWLPPGTAGGCFTAPIPRDCIETSRRLGQNAVTLGNIFEYVSPMVYHRCLGWSAAQTTEYVSWLKERVRAEVLPILQVKDFPDSVPDNLPESEMAELHAAVRTCGLPVAWFSWDSAVEQGKIKALARIWQ